MSLDSEILLGIQFLRSRSIVCLLIRTLLSYAAFCVCEINLPVQQIRASQKTMPGSTVILHYYFCKIRTYTSATESESCSSSESCRFPKCDWQNRQTRHRDVLTIGGINSWHDPKLLTTPVISVPESKVAEPVHMYLASYPSFLIIPLFCMVVDKVNLQT